MTEIVRQPRSAPAKTPSIVGDMIDMIGVPAFQFPVFAHHFLGAVRTTSTVSCRVDAVPRGCARDPRTSPTSPD